MPFNWRKYLELNSDLSYIESEYVAFLHWINEGIYQNRQYTDESSRILKLFVAVDNDIELLEDWIVYHARLVGYENLYIIDKWSTDSKILDQIYPTYSELGVTIIRDDPFHIYKYVYQELMGCDFVIILDIDEFLTLFPDSKYPSTDPKQFQEYLDKLPYCGWNYSISYCSNIAKPQLPYKSPWFPAQELKYWTELKPLNTRLLYSHTISYKFLESNNSVTRKQFESHPPEKTKLAIMNLSKSTFNTYINHLRRILYSDEYILRTQSEKEHQQILEQCINDTKLPNWNKINTYLKYLKGELTKDNYYISDQEKYFFFELFGNDSILSSVYNCYLYSPEHQRYLVVDNKTLSFNLTPDIQQASVFNIISGKDNSNYKYSLHLCGDIISNIPLYISPAGGLSVNPRDISYVYFRPSESGYLIQCSQIQSENTNNKWFSVVDNKLITIGRKGTVFSVVQSKDN